MVRMISNVLGFKVRMISNVLDGNYTSALESLRMIEPLVTRTSNFKVNIREIFLVLIKCFFIFNCRHVSSYLGLVSL